MLKVENMVVSYGSNEVLHGISLEVREGEIVTIIGSNGAGKTTTLKAIAGLLPKGKGSSVRFMDEEISTCPAEQLVQRGIALSPEGRGIFPDLTVLENLEMGAYLRMKDKDGVQADLKRMYQMFPRLEERKKQEGKTLSGGEQQMLAVARALMTRPKLLMLDEPSTGLAPLIVKDIFYIIKEVNKTSGITILLVEQNAKMALNVADRGYVLKNGEIVKCDTGANLMRDDVVRTAYLGEKLYGG